MIINIKTPKTEITYQQILMSQIKTSLYSDPLTFIVNIPFGLNPLTIGDEVTISLNTKQKVKAYYMYSKHQTVNNQKSTTLLFTNVEHMKIRHNLYPKNVSIFGVKMKNILKYANVQELLDFEMRKKGVVFAHKDYELKTIPIDDCFLGKGAVIQNISGFQAIEDVPTRHNYSSIAPNGEAYTTTRGFDYPIYIPFLTKQEIKALDKFITPKLIITSSSLNLDIDVGILVDYYGEKFTVISKIISSVANEYIVSLRLGKIL